MFSGNVKVSIYADGGNSEVLGYWMIKPDGTPATGWHNYRNRIITNDPNRSTTTAIKATCTLAYTSVFPTVGAEWTLSSDTHYTWSPLAGNLLKVAYNSTTAGTYIAATATLDCTQANVLGRVFQPGDYIECTVQRLGGQTHNDAGAIGLKLFGAAAACSYPSGNQPLNGYYTGYNGTVNNWLPISFSIVDGSNPTYNWGNSHTLGARIDSIDPSGGKFATVSFYYDGAYLGSRPYYTSSLSTGSLLLFAQNDDNSSLQFGTVKVYKHN